MAENPSEGLFNTIKNLFQKLTGTVTEKAKPIVEEAVTETAHLAEEAKAAVGDVVEKLSETATGMIGEAKTQLQDTAQEVATQEKAWLKRPGRRFRNSASPSAKRQAISWQRGTPALAKPSSRSNQRRRDWLHRARSKWIPPSTPSVPHWKSPPKK